MAERFPLTWNKNNERLGEGGTQTLVTTILSHLFENCK